MEPKIFRIGIVDDHQLILDGLENLLKSVENYEVVFSRNSAREALEIMMDDPVDLIITDVAMPDMNGAEFIQNLREQFPKVKIMVLSMYRTDLINDEDIDGYLLKESSGTTILKAIKTILKKKPKSSYTSLPKGVVLSKREKEIVVEIGNGLSSEQIAEKLFLSYYTVESHKKNIFLKLNVNTNAELIKKAIHLGVIMN
ncbi:MAG: response regulator transcription factor [Flavobacteriaceae bacterium]|jgi:DNA-binding NarL/FixJ family response regulator|nr:response regulator transcription factor [Flavobacteriaceae bacterium]